MEISDGDRPPPSSVGSCLPTHPPTHQEAHVFLSSLATDGEGVLLGGAGVCPGTGPVVPVGEGGRPGGGGVGDGGPPAVPDGGASHLSDHCPGEAVGPSYRQRERSRRHRRRRAKRNAATTASSLK